MTTFSELKSRFQPILGEFLSSDAIGLLNAGDLTAEQYRSVMKQIFHHTRENPQLQALATVYFRGKQRRMVRSFLKHAISEVGHDQLALNDFIQLGGNAERVAYENPLPATSALLAYGFYQIYNLNHLGYLGYLFFLEFMPTTAGGDMMKALAARGVPDAAMTFMRDHTEIDVQHNRMMENYVEVMIEKDQDLDAIEYSMRTTAYLYAQMLAQAIADVEKPMPVGLNWEEISVDGRSAIDDEQARVA